MHRCKVSGLAFPREYFIEGMQPEVEQAIRNAMKMAEGLGAEIQEVSLPHTDLALPVYYIIAPAEASANLARYDAIRFGPRERSENLLDQYFRNSRQPLWH